MSKLEELIKNLCPDGVLYLKTSELCLAKYWLMPSTPRFVDNGIPYITSKNIKNGNIDYSDVSYISQEDYYSVSKNREILKGDLLITMIGTIGETAIVESNCKFYGQNIYLLRLDPIKINIKYYKFCFDNFVKQIKAKKNTGNQGYLKAGAIETFEIPVPPLEVQDEIVKILDNFTELTAEHTAELTAELESRKKQ